MAIFVLAWQLTVKLGEIPAYVLPGPWDVAEALVRERQALIYHGIYSFFEAFAGLFFAAILAMLFAIMMDKFTDIRLGVYPLLVISQTIPLIVLAPLLVIYVGIGIETKILMVVLMCFFPIAVSTVDAMQNVNENQVNLAALYGATQLQIYTFVKIPSALGSFFSGLRVAATYSLTGAIVGEWVASSRGLGYYIIRAKNGYMLDNVFACIIVVIIESLMLNGMVRLLQIGFMPHLKKS